MHHSILNFDSMRIREGLMLYTRKWEIWVCLQVTLIEYSLSDTNRISKNNSNVSILDDFINCLFMHYGNHNAYMNTTSLHVCIASELWDDLSLLYNVLHWFKLCRFSSCLIFIWAHRMSSVVHTLMFGNLLTVGLLCILKL